MQIESLQVELRPRTPWEAVELGTALVRRHARAIWVPWLLVTLSVFAIVDAAAWAVGHVWIAWLLMWWMKPLFDRIPLYVLSRAVFGATPSPRETLAAQRDWGWRAMLPHLAWRRFGVTRALALPVDLLEGSEPKRLRERRGVLGSGVIGHVVLLTLLCIAFTVVLTVSVLALVALLVPWEWILSESARAAWALLTDAKPPWVQVTLHALVWAATSAIEPFYIGAGFALYLNRRTQIEAWDVEIALRRLRTRLGAGTALAAVLACVLVASPIASHAQGRPPAQRPSAVQCPVPDASDRAPDPREVQAVLTDVFGTPLADDTAFRRGVRQAYRDPLLRPTRKEMVWERRKQDDKPTPPVDPVLFPWLAKLFSVIGEFGLWIVLGGLVLALLLTVKRWWPWVSGMRVRADAPSPVDTSDAALPEVLPPNLAAAARALWAEGRPRRALALLYRGSVDAMATRADVVLVPGATESECLRASRRMPQAEDRDAFARIVRTWQYAAYAQRLPATDEFESLLGTLSQRFGWAA